MKTFGTTGRVRPEQHYIVSRTEDIADFIHRIKGGKYIVLFAPRQTGKTTLLPIGTRSNGNRRSDLFPDSVRFPNDAQYRPYRFLRPALLPDLPANRARLPETRGYAF